MRTRSRLAHVAAVASTLATLAALSCARSTPAVDTAGVRPPASTPAPAPNVSSDSPATRVPLPPPAPVDSTQPPAGASPPATPDTETAAIERIKREAHAIARVGGCTAASECKTIGIGVKACGGPEDYIVYCPKSTDVPALERKVAEVERAQKAYNEKHQMMSTCEYRTPPNTQLVGGSCRAATGGAAAATAVPR
jgi:hypothetical protein